MRFILLLLIFPVFAHAEIAHFITDMTNAKIAQCETVKAKTFAEWQTLVIEDGKKNDIQCSVSKDGEYLVECKSKKDKSEYLFEAYEDMATCKAGRNKLLEKARTSAPKTDTKSLDKESATKLYEKNNCQSLNSFAIKRKIDSKTYEVTSIYRGLTRYSGVAILETTTREYKSSGRDFDLRVRLVGAKSVTMGNGFQKKVPHLIESSECDSYYKAAKQKK